MMDGMMDVSVRLLVAFFKQHQFDRDQTCFFRVRQFMRMDEASPLKKDCFVTKLGNNTSNNAFNEMHLNYLRTIPFETH